MAPGKRGQGQDGGSRAKEVRVEGRGDRGNGREGVVGGETRRQDQEDESAPQDGHRGHHPDPGRGIRDRVLVEGDPRKDEGVEDGVAREHEEQGEGHVAREEPEGAPPMGSPLRAPEDQVVSREQPHEDQARLLREQRSRDEQGRERDGEPPPAHRQGVGEERSDGEGRHEEVLPPRNVCDRLDVDRHHGEECRSGRRGRESHADVEAEEEDEDADDRMKDDVRQVEAERVESSQGVVERITEGGERPVHGDRCVARPGPGGGREHLGHPGKRPDVGVVHHLRPVVEGKTVHEGPGIGRERQGRHEGRGGGGPLAGWSGGFARLRHGVGPPGIEPGRRSRGRGF